MSVKALEERNVFAAVEAALALLGDFGALIPDPRKVLLKPDYDMVPGRSGTTEPLMIEALVRLLRDAGAGEVLIAEGSSGCQTDQAFRLRGVHQIARRYGVPVVDLNWQDGVRKGVPRKYGIKDLLLPELLGEVTAVILLPTLRLSPARPPALGSLLGFLPRKYYGWSKCRPDTLHPEEEREWIDEMELGSEPAIGSYGDELYAALASVVPVTLTLVDAIEVSDGRGHCAPTNRILAGASLVAVDLVAASLMGIDPTELGPLRVATRANLGPSALDQVELRGDGRCVARKLLDQLRDDQPLEIPAEEALALLSDGELRQIVRTYHFTNHLASSPEHLSLDREALKRLILTVMQDPDYLTSLLQPLPQREMRLLAICLGRRGAFHEIEQECVEHLDYGEAFYALVRKFQNLGVLYLTGGQGNPHFVFLSGLRETLAKVESALVGSDAV